jgi:hypothetical protein
MSLRKIKQSDPEVSGQGERQSEKQSESDEVNDTIHLRFSAYSHSTELTSM